MAFSKPACKYISMATWQECAEIAIGTLLIASGALAVVWALVAIIKAYRAAAPLREASRPTKRIDHSQHTDEYRAQVEAHWEKVRKQARGYAEDVNLLINPLRRDTIEYVKESANWGRLGVQYALIGNGAALTALPYLLGLAKTSPATVLTILDARWSAWWFTGGLMAAALTCAIAYIDFQIHAGVNWSSIDLDYKLAMQRHHDIEVDSGEYALRQEIQNQLRATNVVTSLAGIWLAILAWVALSRGAIRLINSLQV
ncbi:MAG: hypothetical protein LCH88_16750 [Proteobacteria bacterium]|nr:hypothetical protein [Pseudomonadota bacterium]MCA0319710.1 hypothetical protein [Pseudomonadota bacterium]